jgi:chromosomal replication initiator protein
MQQIWQTIQTKLRLRLGNIYDAWFLGITFLKSEQDNDRTLIIFKAPNDYYASYMSENYAEIIKEEFYLQCNFEEISILFLGDTPAENPQITAAPESQEHSDLTKEKSFSNFVVGACNQLAHASAYAVAEHPGEVYNPLFIFGSTGLGKTHLLHAIGNKISSERPRFRILYVTAEQFTNELISAFRHRKTNEFQLKFRTNCDLLLMDDVQFFSGKERTQEELFHTFEWLKKHNRQIVFTADMFPREIIGLEERLRSRCESGMVADTQPPDQETLLAILYQKSEAINLILDKETAHYIASGIHGNIRELEGVLTRLKALCDLYRATPSLDFAKLHLQQFVHEEQQISQEPQKILSVVATTFGLQLSDLKGSSRKKALVRARHIAIYLIRENTELSLPEIGRIMGRDHTTIYHAHQKINNERCIQPDLSNTLELICRNLQEPAE